MSLRAFRLACAAAVAWAAFVRAQLEHAVVLAPVIVLPWARWPR